jgi:SpoIIAA-like
MMIKILEGFPDNVVATSATGHVTREDYDAVLIPHVEITAERHSRIRRYYEISKEFAGMEAGAIWEDFMIAAEYWMQLDRVAVLTDVAWIAREVNALRLLMPFQMHVYQLSERDRARIWILWQ